MDVIMAYSKWNKLYFQVYYKIFPIRIVLNIIVFIQVFTKLSYSLTFKNNSVLNQSYNIRKK